MEKTKSGNNKCKVYTSILIVIVIACSIVIGMDYMHTSSMDSVEFIAKSQFECKKTMNGSINGMQVTGTYDLCDFVVGTDTKDGWYAAYDNRTHGNIESGGDAVNYTFYFNIASNIAKPTPDPECDNYNITWRQYHGLEIGYCQNIASYGLFNATCKNPAQNIVPITTMTAAYQAKKGSTYTDKCWRLHDGVTEPVWTFIDESDPALGIQLTYLNGDWCASFGKNREFKMKFKCSNDIAFTPKYVETVYEPIDEGCSYEIVMNTYKGCPLECPVINDQLCDDHGICDYDWKLGKPKCFCFCGWSGNSCSIPINEVCDEYINITQNNNCGGDGKCILTDSNGITAQYDLSFFNLKNDVFTVQDIQNPSFEYKFNIGGPISVSTFTNSLTMPRSCLEPNTLHGPCITLKQETNNRSYECVAYENTVGRVPSAVQIDHIDNSSKCYWLGMEVATTDMLPQFKIELLDIDDAGRGVIYTILNGEWCASVGRNRELRIKLECPDDDRVEFEPGSHQTQIQNGMVEEIDTCIYELKYSSPLACPTNCISRTNIEMFSVCATHGICASDPSAGFIRCLCDDGYWGNLCENVVTQNPTRAPSVKGQTYSPTTYPTNKPSISPTRSPLKTGETHQPTTGTPTYSPTTYPTNKPSIFPTRSPLKTGETHQPTTVSPTLNTVNVNNTQSKNSNTSPTKDNHMVPIWIMIVIIVVLIGIVGFCFYQNRKNRKMMADFVLIEEQNQQNQETDRANL